MGFETLRFSIMNEWEKCFIRPGLKPLILGLRIEGASSLQLKWSISDFICIFYVRFIRILILFKLYLILFSVNLFIVGIFCFLSGLHEIFFLFLSVLFGFLCFQMDLRCCNGLPNVVMILLYQQFLPNVDLIFYFSFKWYKLLFFNRLLCTIKYKIIMCIIRIWIKIPLLLRLFSISWNC